MIANFSQIFDGIYNQNKEILEKSKNIYLDYCKGDRSLKIKKGLSIATMIITLPLFPISLLWDIPLFIHLNNSEVKLLKRDDGEYVKVISNNLIKPLLNKIFSATNYDMLNGIERTHYNIASNNEEYDMERFSSHNLIEIPVIENKYNLKLSNVFTQKEETYYDVNDNMKSRVIDVFSGIVGMIQLPFNINSKLVVTEESIKENLVELDMKEFETKFNVSATNEVIAYQILTADVMQKIVDMKNDIYKTKFDIVINNDTLYIRVHNKTAFNFNIEKDIDKKAYEESVETIELVKNMSEDILNIISESNIG